MALEFPQDNWRMPNNQKSEASIDGEFFILMSLALDGMLSSEEESRFHQYIEEDPALAKEWQTWQGMTTQFEDEPSVSPPAGFVQSVSDRLLMEQSDSEVHVLMSLALDGLLSSDEEIRFHRYLEQDPILANDWLVWQDFNAQFDSEPSMMPPEGFVQSVTGKLVMQERRSKLRLGIFVGAITTVTWLLLVLALVGAGAYMAMYQAPWIGQQIANLTILTSNVATWFSIASDNFTRIFEGAVNPYQVWGIVLAYVAAAGLVLNFWTRFLRRSIGQQSIGQQSVGSVATS